MGVHVRGGRGTGVHDQGGRGTGVHVQGGRGMGVHVQGGSTCTRREYMYEKGGIWVYLYMYSMRREGYG